MATINVYSLVPCGDGQVTLRVVSDGCGVVANALCTVTYGISDTAVAAGRTDSQGRFRFGKTCGTGIYHVVVEPIDLCHERSSSMLPISDPCGDEETIVRLLLKQTFVRCNGFVMSRNLYVHDAFSSGLAGTPQVMNRDRVFQSIRDTIAYVDVDTSACHSTTCQSARGSVQKREVLQGQGQTSVLYEVTCDLDEHGPCINVRATWGVIAAQSIEPWLNIGVVDCCYWTDPASGITYCHGPGCPCAVAPVGRVRLVDNSQGTGCLIADPLVATLTNHYLYAPEGPYGTGHYTATAIGRYYPEACCLSSLAVEIELKPEYCINGYGTFFPTGWLYELDEGTATINNRGRLGLDLNCPYCPEPPGGATILLTS